MVGFGLILFLLLFSLPSGLSIATRRCSDLDFSGSGMPVVVPWHIKSAQLSALECSQLCSQPRCSQQCGLKCSSLRMRSAVRLFGGVFHRACCAPCRVWKPMCSSDLLLPPPAEREGASAVNLTALACYGASWAASLAATWAASCGASEPSAQIFFVDDRSGYASSSPK